MQKTPKAAVRNKLPTSHGLEKPPGFRIKLKRTRATVKPNHAPRKMRTIPRNKCSGFLLVTFPAAAYLVAADASSSGATFGKRLMGIRVISTAGGRLSIFRSVLRTGIRFIPWELAHSAVWRTRFGAEFSPHSIPFVLVIACYALVLANVSSQFFDHRHRAIYDFIARSQVNWISAKPRISTPIADR